MQFARWLIEMGKDSDLDDLVHNVLCGIDIRLTFLRLRKSGRAGVNKVLDAMEGKLGQPPKSRHPRDVHDDLIGVLQAVAKGDVTPLIDCLKSRPEHAWAVIWALGSSRRKIATATLIEYSRHKEMWVRWSAVEGLARNPKESSMNALLAALSDRSDMVRFSALIGLESIADDRAIEGIRRYLANKRLSPGGKSIAAELLTKLEKRRKS